MLLYACAYDVKSEMSLDTGDSASDAVVKRSVLSANERCAECVSLYYELRTYGKNALLFNVTVCEKLYHG